MPAGIARTRSCGCRERDAPLAAPSSPLRDTACSTAARSDLLRQRAASQAPPQWPKSLAAAAPASRPVAVRTVLWDNADPSFLSPPAIRPVSVHLVPRI